MATCMTIAACTRTVQSYKDDNFNKMATCTGIPLLPATVQYNYIKTTNYNTMEICNMQYAICMPLASLSPIFSVRPKEEVLVSKTPDTDLKRITAKKGSPL